MGQFTLGYPSLRKQGDKPAYDLVEKQITGNTALVKYAGGAQIQIDVNADNTLALAFSNVPSDVRVFRMEMLIDLGYAQGGTFRLAGGTPLPFPREKPAKPFLYQGNNQALTIANFEGKSLAFELPEFSFQQLQDNREWGWATYQWMFQTPFNPDHLNYTVKIMAGAGSSAGPKPLVDQFGQSTLVDYPDKLKSLDELKADVAAEKAYYDALTPPTFDPYGGLPESGAKLGLAKTGFFHVQKHDARWLLVDPAGNAFFHLGLCGFNPSDDYTYIQGREGTYAWIPPFDGDFRWAYRPDSGRTGVSFHVANMIRKYGAPYDLESYLTRMIGRVRRWGFNSAGAFSPVGNQAYQEAMFPYVGHLPLAPWEGFAELPGAPGAWDPFSDRNRQHLAQLFAEKLPARADDPLLIGYFLVNEPLYENLPRAIPALNGKFACKRRLVQVLREKYATIDRFNTAWGTTAKEFDELNDQGLSVATAQAADDVNRFVQRFLELYFQLVADAFHKHDQHHLLLGNRLQAGTINNQQLCRLMGRYVDVVSFNYYTYHLDKEFLDRIYDWTGGKPMILSEFHFNAPAQSGLLGGIKQVATHEERGLGYRHYVEHAAALGYVVGTEWFTLVDQSVSGRWFSRYNGECSNTGLIAVTDRPWKPMVAQMRTTNYSIYDVLFGRRSPFVYDNPLFRAAARP